MAFELEDVLKSEWGLDGDDLKTVLGVLKPKSEQIAKGYLRQSDYSREMDKVKTIQKQYEDNNEKLNADLAEFATLTAGEQANATALRERIEKAENKSFALTQKITRFAEENGIDPKTLLGDVEPQREPEKKVAAFDDKALRGDFDAKIGGVAGYMLDLTAALPGIAEEYHRLTGKTFDQRAFVQGIKADIAAKKADNLDPQARFEAQFDIPTLRETAREKGITDRIAAGRAEERAAVLSEQAIPGAQRPGEHSPVLKFGESKLQRPQPGNRLSGAVAALANGTYRDRGRTATT